MRQRAFRRSRWLITLIPLILIVAMLASARLRPRLDDSVEVHVLFPGSVRFFDVEREAMVDEAAERGIRLLFWNAEWDPALQLEQVAQAADAGADVIALAVVDVEVGKLARDAIGTRKAQLITFTNGVGLEPPWTIEGVVSHISRDEYLAGELLGQQTLDALDRSGSILSIEGAPGTTPQTLRFLGLQDAISEAERVRITGRVQVPDWSLRELEFQLTTSIDLAQPDVIAVQWADAAVVVSSYLRNNDIDNVRVVSLEWTQALADEMSFGVIVSSTFSSVSEEGRLVVDTIDAVLSGETVPEYVEVGQRVVEADQADGIEAEW